MNERTVLWIVIAILALFFLAPTLGGLGWGHGWMMGRWGGWGGPAPWGSSWFFWLGPLLQLLLVIGVIVVVIFALTRSRPSHPAAETPLEILRRRYAAGEISKEEFEEARRILGV